MAATLNRPAPSPSGAPNAVPSTSGASIPPASAADFGAPSFGERLAPVAKRVLGKTADAGKEPAGLLAFEAEADAVMSRSKTARAQRIIRAVVLVVVGLIVWAGFARVDEVTKGDGKVIPSRQLQVVQSLDGGVVSEILVREGQEVDEGQLLLKIDETRATSGVRENDAQAFALKVKHARLKALAEGGAFSPPRAKAGDADAQRIIDEERNLYQSRMSELAGMVSISRQQVMQREQEASEARARRESAQRAIEISRQELAKTRPLLTTGAVSEVDILRLERDITRNRGEIEQAAAQMQRTQAAIGEAQRKVSETELQFRNEARKELSEVLGKLSALNEGSVALVDRVTKSQVKSPVRGRVQRLLANTVGGVLQPGKDLSLIHI